MSRAQQYSRYEPVSYDNAPSYPQWEVPSGARKEMPSTGVSLMQSPTNDFQSPPGVSEPNYHHADSRSPSMFSRLLRFVHTLSVTPDICELAPGTSPGGHALGLPCCQLTERQTANLDTVTGG